jgi:tripartite ATP-independent transporter DctP family solute receptor
MLRDVRHGTLDLAFITGTPLPDVVAEVGAFSIPFIFDGVSHAHDMLDGPVGQACLNKFQDSSLVALAWGENGMRQLTNSRRPIRTPADLKGLKLGVPQSAVALVGFETLGADAGALACPDLYSALETGRFDGQDNPVSTIQAARLWQVQRHLTLSNHSYDPAVILMSPKLHDALPDNDRDAFGEAARLAGLASRRFAAESLAMGAALLNQAGMEVVSAFDRALFVAALTPARQKFDDMFGAGLVGWIRDQNIA